MEAGKLRHRVQVEERLEEQDATGQEITTWRKVGQRWASIEALTGREFIEAQALASDVTCRVRMRYLADLTPGHRLVAGERVLEIIHVIDRGGRRAEQELLCKEVV